MRSRRLPQQAYLTFKAATRQLVTLAGGQEAAERISRVGHQEFSNYGSPSGRYEDRFIPIDIVADLEEDAGEPVVTRALARLANHILVPAPKVKAASCTVEALAKVAKEGGEATAAIAGLLDSGGAISATQRGYALKQIDEAVVALLEARNRLDGGTDQ